MWIVRTTDALRAEYPTNNLPEARFAVLDDQANIIDSMNWLTEAAASARASTLNAQRVSMVAAATDGAEGRAFYAVLAVDEWDSADGRYLEHFEWEICPLSLFTLDENSEWGHVGAEASGSIRTVERLSDGRRIFATGFLNTTEEGLQTEAQIESQTLRFISVDPSDYECEEEITVIGTDGWPIEGRLRFTNYVIGAATVVATPAIRFAVIWLDGMDAPQELTLPLPEPIPRVQIPEIRDVGDDDDIIVIMAGADSERPGLSEEVAILSEDDGQRALLASAHAARASSCLLTRECGGPVLPPAEWFDDPHFTGPTPLTVDEDGHVYGHFALWNVPHRGFLHYEWSDRIYAPRSVSGYAQFRTRATLVACCDDADCGHERRSVATGPLVLGTIHAGGRLTAAQAAAFYENTGYTCADLAAGDDAWGPWINGALRPGTDDARVRELLGAAPSGDWRRINGSLELIACLMVNTEGIPVVRASAYVDQGQVQSLAMGWGRPLLDDIGEHHAESLVASLRGRAGAAAARSRLNGGIIRVEGGMSPDERARLERLERKVERLDPAIAEQLIAEINEFV